MARPSRLEDPEYCKLVAECIVQGLTRQEIADKIEAKNLDTVTRYRRDPRVKAICMRLIEDRTIQISRKVDAEVEERLKNASDLSLRELLEIRKEFLGGQARAATEKADDATINEATTTLEDPAAMKRFLAELPE